MKNQSLSPHTIREAILTLVQARGPQKSICPSEVARRLVNDDEEWRDQLEPKTIRYYDTFFQCVECGKIYWRGTHYERMQEFLAALDIDS